MLPSSCLHQHHPMAIFVIPPRRWPICASRCGCIGTATAQYLQYIPHCRHCIKSKYLVCSTDSTLSDPYHCTGVACHTDPGKYRSERRLPSCRSRSTEVAFKDNVPLSDNSRDANSTKILCTRSHVIVG